MTTEGLEKVQNCDEFYLLVTVNLGPDNDVTWLKPASIFGPRSQKTIEDYRARMLNRYSAIWHV